MDKLTQIIFVNIFRKNIAQLNTNWHSPSPSHIPVFLSCALQLRTHDHSPILHRNPASAKDATARTTKQYDANS